MERSTRRKPPPMPASESSRAKAELDRLAIERWESEGGTPLSTEARLRTGPRTYAAPHGYDQS